MRGILTGIATLILALGLAACGDGQRDQSMAYGAASAPAMADVERAQLQKVQGDGEPGLAAMLAYEHSASIQIPAELIPQRQQAVQAACNAA